MKERINTNPPVLHFVLRKNRDFPNSTLPVLIYRKAVNLPLQKNKASQIIQHIFIHNGWSNSWRNEVYRFHHYHSLTHECMGISMGSATVLLGGTHGKKIKLTQGDVLIIPAGVAHKCLKCSETFQCVGAYPQGKEYDINVGATSENLPAVPNIARLPVPSRDPVLGKHGLLHTYWK